MQKKAMFLVYEDMSVSITLSVTISREIERKETESSEVGEGRLNNFDPTVKNTTRKKHMINTTVAVAAL